MPDNKAKALKPTSDAVEILHRRLYEGKPTRLKNLEEARANEEIARKIQELRAAADLTQTQLPCSSAPLHRSSAALRMLIMRATPWRCCAGLRAR